MSVLVVDYGVGNLASVKRAVEECGASVWVSNRPDDIDQASHVILPGVGSFADGMQNLTTGGWVPRLRTAAIEDRVPLLGICLGMQLLADAGEEGRETAGLGLIAGVVKRLKPTQPFERLPHVGWNEVKLTAPSPVLSNIPDHSDFYFVHSYHFQPVEEATILGRTPYCGEFASIVGRDNVIGVQFHPEKSSRHGLQLIRNFLGLGVG